MNDTTELTSILQQEFEELRQSKNSLPDVPVEVVYVFSGPEKYQLAGACKDRLETGVALWHRLKRQQEVPPIFLYQGDAVSEYPFVQSVFSNHIYAIDESFLVLRPMKVWKSTVDQFTKIPKALRDKTSWLIVTSPWHLPRVRRYAAKYWKTKHVYFWGSPYHAREFFSYQNDELRKIIQYRTRGDL